VVTKDIPDNCVAAGVPARPLQTLAAYREKISDEIFERDWTDRRDRRAKLELRYPR
jgi:serine acetyltransferase